jgi:hypothetical protein
MGRGHEAQSSKELNAVQVSSAEGSSLPCPLYSRNALMGVLASGPVVICAIKSGSLIYQFGEATTKLSIENFLDALGVHAFILRQRIKPVLY